MAFHAGGISVAHFRDFFGGASKTDKLITPAGIWSMRGAELILSEATVAPTSLAAFSGRYYIGLENRYLDKSLELETASFKSVGLQDTEATARMVEVRQNLALLGQDGQSFALRRGTNTQDLFVSGSSSTDAGGAIRLTGSQGTEAERVELRTSNTVRMRVDNTLVTAFRPVKLQSYTVANLPNPTTGNTGSLAWCTNISGLTGGRVVYSTGSGMALYQRRWRRELSAPFNPA